MKTTNVKHPSFCIASILSTLSLRSPVNRVWSRPVFLDTLTVPWVMSAPQPFTQTRVTQIYNMQIIFIKIPIVLESDWSWPSRSNLTAKSNIILPPASTKLIVGYTGITLSVCPSVRLSVRPSVRPSVCGQNRVRSVSSRILIGSISYLHILSSNFRRCVACNARFKMQKFEILANF